MKKLLLLLALFVTAATSLNAEQTLTVAEGDNHSNYAPFNGPYWHRLMCRSQVFYPASMLTDMVEHQINSITFYADAPVQAEDNGVLVISLGRTEKKNYYGDTSFIEGLTPVDATIVNHKIAEGNYQVEVVFSTPYFYSGGGLVFDTQLLDTGENFWITFYGSRDYNMGYYYWGMDQPSFMNFLPKATFKYSEIDNQVTVADNPEKETVSSSAPYPVYFWDVAGSRSQVIYPADSLTNLIGSKITGLRFYVKHDNGMWFRNGKVTVSLGTTNLHNFTKTFIEDVTPVAVNYPGPDSEIYEIDVNFDTPFVYDGGNLVYDCVLTEAGEKGSYLTNFRGVDTDEGPYAYNYFTAFKSGNLSSDANVEIRQFLPRTSFFYERVFVTTDKVDFGELIPSGTASGQKTMTVLVRNQTDAAVTPTLSGLQAPFSSTYTPRSIAPGENYEIPITFAPDAVGTFNNTVTITVGGETYDVALTGKASRQLAIVVCDGTDKNFRMPLYCSYANAKNTHSQMIYPAEMLTAVAGNQILGVKFFASETIDLSSPTIQFCLKETTRTNFGNEESGYAEFTDLTPVCSINPANGSTELTFMFDEPYEYNGGNLALEARVTKPRSYKYIEFYGMNQSENTGYSVLYLQGHETFPGDETPEHFLPKMLLYVSNANLPEIRGDINGDGQVNTGDVSELYKALLSGSTDSKYDLNGDGSVNTGDVSALYKIILGQ